MSTFQIIGVLNVTPDSFHDGGKFNSLEEAVAQAGRMIKDGADILDIGGESTGPKSPEVSLDEELRRVLPVIQAVRKKYPEISISVDTWKSAVAKAALAEGVQMINDVTAGRGDREMFTTVAQSDAKLVLMYSKDPTPRTTIEMRQYEDVLKSVSTFLDQRKSLAVESGINSERIILDPGLGHFVSSDPQYSFQILRELKSFLKLGSPLLVSPSRKSFLAGSENLKTVDRLPGTIAASAIAILNGATYIRTHDVREVRRGCEIAVEISKNQIPNHK